MKSLAIITARGGSKRIPKKNIKEFCGKPIIAYSIEAALKSHIFDEVMVSTDDDEIRSVAIKYGASVPFMRSKENSDDFSTTTDVLLEVINEYKKKNIYFDSAVCIYPTAPFITSQKLSNAMKCFLEGNVSSLISVVPFSYPPQRGMIIKNQNLVLINQNNENSRSQDLEQIYHDAGQFYILKVEDFLSEKTIFSNNMMPYILSELEVQDIDTQVDWEIAEIKYLRINNKGESVKSE